MTEYVATRWYRAPEVMLCELYCDLSLPDEALFLQDRSIPGVYESD